MKKRKLSKIKDFDFMILFCSVTILCFYFCGCSQMSGYSDELMFRDDISSVYVKMFDNQSFRRGAEYELTDALAKRIEAETPYKVVNSEDRAETLISGQIESIGEQVLTMERETGRTLENEVILRAVVNWKNLTTGEFLIDNRVVTASASYSRYQSQDFDYASAVAANKLAERIVELMEKEW